MLNSVLPRRDEPDTWYPAGVPGVTARWLTLADGERVRIVELESGVHSSTAPDALLLHGWGCNAFHYRHLLPALATRGVRASAIDLRGHGVSSKPTDVLGYTSSALATFTERVLDALSLPRAGLVGHSLGGAIALDLALARPSRVQWLALLNTVGLSRMALAPLFRRAPLRYAEHVPAILSRAVGYAALNLAYGGIARPEAGDLEQYLYPTLTPGGRFGMLAYARAFTWEPRSVSVVARIACPVHAMFGERDRVIGSREAIERLRALPTARAEVIPRAGHVLAEETPEMVAEAVVALAHSAAPNAERRGLGATP